MLQPEMLQCNNCYILGKLLHFWFSTSTRNVTIMLQLLHFGQIVTFWADNVDQKCNNHVTKILLHFGSMSGIFLKKKMNI